MRYTEKTPISDRDVRVLVVNPVNPHEENPSQFMVVEQFWNEKVGYYWGEATGAPSVFESEKDADEWVAENERL